ncbi:NAD(P)-dependent oxidoreductase [Actinacidiphila acididurans]|uniref:NAD(P)-dependent oxidoreductase n=1 Tax=Actinacidiphila acididurans TaxID=2784346 RepID=A0ABS2TJ57_9ACTN|nr:NAD(P)-dependent oxidoreductase [Actinacidiphila acididurans]MBM9503370.1 NAD(P)-dependent oxidoreductase [Actinacidiphila acididurans]
MAHTEDSTPPSAAGPDRTGGSPGPVRTVGLVGLGAMGGPAAGFLARSGVVTYCYDADPAAMGTAAAEGVRTAGSVPELAASSDVVVVTVPSDQDVLDVCSPGTGVLSAAVPGTVVLICSSVTPATCRAVAAQAVPLGVDVLDAALTGGVRAAVAGTVNLLVGGDAAVLERIRPVLAPWTRTVHHLGPLGAGQIGKTVNNLCHWGQLAAVVEALRLGRALGVPPARLREALLDGPAASRTLAEMELMRLTWHRKDLANALLMAEDEGRTLPVATTVREAMEHITVQDIAELYAEPPFPGTDPVPGADPFPGSLPGSRSGPAGG